MFTFAANIFGSPTNPSAVPKKGHIMISYNWGNQPIVKRIAQSLQEKGYTIWLDLEQMGGSTLEASILTFDILLK